MLAKRTVVPALLLFLLALALRLPYLGGFLTPDEQRIWTTLTAQFLSALLHGDWAGTATSGYPGVLTTWAASLGLGLQWLLARPEGISSLADMADALLVNPQRLDMLPWMRLGVALLCSLGITVIFLHARRLLGQGSALLMAAFLSFDPFLLAHTRLINTDPLLAISMTVAWLALLAALQEGRRRYLLLGGMSLGLALLTKTPALLLVPLMVTWLFWHHGHRQQTLAGVVGRTAVDLFLVGMPALLTLLLLWPALWVTPVEALRRVWQFSAVLSQTGHELGNYWLGQPVAGPGAGFYGAVLLWRSTAVTLPGLLLALVTMTGRRARASSAAATQTSPTRIASISPYHKGAARALLLYVLWLSLSLSFSPKQFDRYLLPVFPVLDILAAWGWVEALRWAAGRWRSRPLPAEGLGPVTQRPKGRARAAYLPGTRSLPLATLLGVTSLIVVQAWSALIALPTYLTAYNPVVGGIGTAQEIMLVGWGEGLEEAAAFLNEQPQAEKQRVAAWYGHNVFGPFYRGQVLDAFYDLPKASDTYAQDIDYVVTYINQIQRGLLPDSVRSELAEPVLSIDQEGIPLAQVYRWPKPFAHTTDRQLAPGLRLVGWAIEVDEPPGRAVAVTLYWDEAQVMVSSHQLPPIQVWIKDDQGEVWVVEMQELAESSQLMPQGWPDRPVLAQRFVLRLPVGLLAGSYRVEMAPIAAGSLLLDSIQVHATGPGEYQLDGLQPALGAPRFGDAFRLLGYGVERTDTQLKVELLWDTLSTPSPGTKFFLHLADGSEHIVAQQDGDLPGLDRPGEQAWGQIGGLARMRTRMSWPAGDLEHLALYLGLYEGTDGLRLPLQLQDRSIPDGRLLLATFTGDR